MTHLLIVGSDKASVPGLAAEAAKNGWQSVVASDITQTMRMLYDYQPAAVVLDAALGNGVTAWVIFFRLREVCDTPILVFTCNDSEDARIDALRSGADDAVSHSCTAAEIVMRVRNLIQHHAAAATMQTQAYRDGVLEYDLQTRSLSANGRSVNLAPGESRLLIRFLQEPDRILSCAELTQALWGKTFQGGSDGVKVYIHRLRCKMHALVPEKSYITNHRSIGYRFR